MKYLYSLLLTTALFAHNFAQKKPQTAHIPGKTVLTSVISDDPETVEQQAAAYLNKEDFDNALIYYAKLIKLSPQNARGYYNLAWIYNKTDRPQQAIDVAFQALKNVEAQKKWEFQRTIGISYTELKQYKEGQKYLQMALLASPEDDLTRYNLGYNYFKTKNFEQAVPLLNVNPEDEGEPTQGITADRYFYLATSLQQLRRFDEALHYFDKAIAIQPYHSYFFNKAQTYLELQRPQDAINTATEGIRKNPDEATLYFKRSQAYRDKKDTMNAERDLSKAYALDPNDASILMDMAVAANGKNEIAKALAFYERALSAGSDDTAAIYSNMANIFAKDPDRTQKAFEYYEKAIKADPGKFSFYYNIANLYRDEKNYKKAIQNYRKANKLEPKNSLIYTNLAVTYSMTGDFVEAKKVLKQGLSIAPDDYGLNALMAQIVYEQDQDYPATIAYSSQALSSEPKGRNNSQLLNIRGNARQQTGDLQNALYDYLTIYQQMPDSDKESRSGALGNIAYIYLEMKDWKNAEKYFDQSLKLSSDIDPLIGKMILYHESGQQGKLDAAKNAAFRADARLRKGISGLAEIEKEGYFYTEKQKAALTRILAK